MSISSRLRITEIFYSLQGEARAAGIPTVFVRLTGCPLRCQYCDTAYAFQGGEWLSFEAILDKIKSLGSRYVCVTGGEPLAQKQCKPFLQLLCDEGFEVSLETSGAIDVGGISSQVSRVVDLKTPDSAECDKNLMANIDLLNVHDQIKIVLCSRDDYEWAKVQISQYELIDKVEVLLSVSFDQLKPETLAKWILEDKLNVRFQVQLHKLLWADEPGR